MRSWRWIAAAALVCVAAAAGLPRKAPDYSINLVGGKTLPLSQYKGHVVVLVFIQTYCEHCQATIGVFGKMQKEYGPRGLQVVASAIEKDPQLAVPMFIRNFAPPFPVGYDTADSAAAFIQSTAKLPLFPMIAFIDRQGMIRAQTEGEEPFFNDLERNLRNQIEALLKAAPGRG